MTNLGVALTAYLQKLDAENRLIAADIGISESTLTRVKQGKMPDAEGLLRIMAWMLRSPVKQARRGTHT